MRVSLKIIACIKNYLTRNLINSKNVNNHFRKILDKMNNLYKKYPRMFKINLKLINTLLNQTKQEFPFLKEVESTSLQQSSRDLLKSYQMFFKIPKSSLPKFHTKKNGRLSLSASTCVNAMSSREYINLLNSPEIKINNITISYDNFKYFAIVNIEAPVNEWSCTGKAKGFDLNSNQNHFLVSSDGDKYQFDVNHEIQMIKKLNKSLSTKKKGSRAFKSCTRRLNKWYEKIKNKLREDYSIVSEISA